jgi:TRAP-type mannitol/chloroaromatic compound transport system substrate-binding protein
MANKSDQGLQSEDTRAAAPTDAAPAAKRSFVSRRNILRGTAVAATLGGAALLASCEKKSEGPAVSTSASKAKFQWRLAHSFGPTSPVISTHIKQFADGLRQMSGGALDIKVFGGGELVPPFGVFGATKEGSIEMFFSASYYWAGQVPATQYTCSVPFGMNAQQVNAWLYHGGGLDLWREFYAKQGLISFLAGNTGTQMTGWFRKEIKHIGDLNGLKMRIPGLGGKVYAEHGVKVILLPQQEIFPSLERGVIDAAEWVGPLYDYDMGLHNAAKYYYSPGWHEPSTNNELTVNLKAWESLPKEIQEMVNVSTYRMNVSQLAEFDARNREYLVKIRSSGKNEIKFLPKDVLKALYKTAEKINDQVADSDPDARKVYDHYKAFRDGVRKWHEINEWAFKDALVQVGAIT